jgi:hypothetical protein
MFNVSAAAKSAVVKIRVANPSDHDLPAASDSQRALAAD